MIKSLISIIIPVYKVEKYLPRCIESVLNQTYKNFELILVDDGSPDNSGKICDEYALRDNRIKVIHKENGGVSSARNTGIDAASGEYINFIDSDDWVPENSLEILINAILSNDADLSVGGYELRQIKAKKISLPDNILSFSENLPIDAKNLKILDWGHFHSCWCKLFKRDIVLRHNLRFDLDIKLGEDCLFVRNYLFYVRKIVTLSQNVYYYNLLNEYSATKKSFTNMGRWSVDGINSFINLLNKFSIENGNKDLLIAELVFRRLNFCFYKHTQDINKNNAIFNIKETIEHFSILLNYSRYWNMNDKFSFLRKAIIENNIYNIYSYYKKGRLKNKVKFFIQKFILIISKNVIEKKRDGLN